MYSPVAQRWTLIIIVILLGLLLIWDIWLAMNSQSGDTISAVVHRYGRQSWFVLIGMGVLIGHFFWAIEDGRLTPDEWKDHMTKHPEQFRDLLKKKKE